MTDRAGLDVAEPLARFIEAEVLPPLGVGADGFWVGVAAIFARFSPENVELLAIRDTLQAQVDAWYRDHPGERMPEAFLRQIGYLVPEPARFATGQVYPFVMGFQRMLGVVSVEVAGHLRWALADTDAFVERQLDDLLADLVLPAPT